MMPVAGLAIMASGGPVLAQSPADQPPATEPVAEGTPASPAGLEDIIVTARRRNERLQRVPVSVIALSARELEARSLTNLRALQYVVPNLTFTASQNVGEAAANLFIRGIGQEDFAVSAEPGVGFYVDGVYQARTFGTLANLHDVSRIEVLRGPQGTLFGRNTIGGAINIVSVVPESQPEGRASVIAGSDGRLELRGVVNVPLTTGMFVRLSGALVRRDGYVHRKRPPWLSSALPGSDYRAEGDDRTEAGRAQLRWLATDTTTVDLSLDAMRRRNSQGATHVDMIDPRYGVFRQLNRLIREGKLPGPEIGPQTVPENPLESFASGRNWVDQDIWGGSVVVTQDLSAHALKFIGAYRDVSSRVGTDTDGLYFRLVEADLDVRQNQLSGELQLSGTFPALDYTAGLFAIGEESRLPPTAAFMNETLYACGCFYTADTVPAFVESRRRSAGTNFAAYAQGTYRLSGLFGLTLGARYSIETKSIEGQTFRLDAALRPTDEIVETGANRGSWDSFTYRAGLEFQVRPTIMAYASLARGFKSGGFNSRISPGLPNLGFASINPETALTFEAGVRSEWLNRRLRVNLTAFHTDYEDIQLRRQTVTGGVVATFIENAARARIRGFEIELAALPLKGLSLTTAYGHLAPKYLDTGNVSGITLSSRFQRSPRHSLSAALDYQASLPWAELEVHADASYRSREQFQILPAFNDQPGFALFGGRITLRTFDNRFSFALFGTNLSDERYRTAGRGVVSQTGIAYSSVGMPRQLGVELGHRF